MLAPVLPFQTDPAVSFGPHTISPLVESAALPLQTADSLGAFEYGVIAIEILTVVLGLVIAYIAVQGYRRNDSRPMAFVAMGFVILVGVPTVLSVVLLFTSLLPQEPTVVVISVSEAVGMGSILYGLRGPASS